MISFDKKEVKENLTLDQIFELLQEWGGDPEYSNFGIISSTICHNPQGEGSRKLYYYDNSQLFHCYTGCGDTFDIFELTIKIMNIQKNIEFNLNDAVCFIAFKFGIISSLSEGFEVVTPDWDIFKNYTRIQNLEQNNYNVVLKEYNQNILNIFNYKVKIIPWLRDGIAQTALDYAKIGYYAGNYQITIPHYDINNRLIGLRGRTLSIEDAEKYGKYRPLYINNQLYSHPLGMNLYNLNNSKNNIKKIEKAIIFESEKSCLLYQTYFGFNNDISVACCGSSISAYHIHLLQQAGAKEIIIAFDRQFQKLGDNEFTHLTTNLTKINNKYNNSVNLSFIFDKKMITSYKASPIDEGKEKFLTLFKERIVL